MRYEMHQMAVTPIYHDWQQFHQVSVQSFGQYLGGYGVIDGEILYNYAKDCDDGYIVELGRFGGASTFILAAGAKASEKKEKVISIDSMTNPIINGSYFLMSDAFGLSDQIISMVTTTEVASKVLDVSIGVLLIDAAHTYNDVKNDIMNYYDKVIEGGVILFHDYQGDDVRRAIDEVIVDQLGQHYTIEGQWAVVRKNEQQAIQIIENNSKRPKMLLFNNHHEGSVAHSLLFGKRLGFDLYFAGADFRQAFGLDIRIDMFSGAYRNAWETFPDGKQNYGHSCEYWLRHGCFGNLDEVFIKDIFVDDFMSTDFDYVFITRSELIELGRKIKEIKPDIKLLAYSGNPFMDYPPDFNLIASSTEDYIRHEGKKILAFHEILPEFSYVKVPDEFRKTIRTFLNPDGTQYQELFVKIEKALNDIGYRLFVHGHNGRDEYYHSLEDGAQLHKNCVGVIHLKEGDGYGLTMAHIASTGRLIFTDRNFYMGKILYPIVNTWGVHIDSKNQEQAVKTIIQSLSQIDDNYLRAQACWVAKFFNYERNAEIVKSFLENL